MPIVTVALEGFWRSNTLGGQGDWIAFYRLLRRCLRNCKFKWEDEIHGSGRASLDSNKKRQFYTPTG